MTLPGRGLLRLLLAWCLLAVVAAAWPAWRGAWVAAGVAVAGAAAVVWLRLGRVAGVMASRRVPGSLPLGEWTTVTVELVSRSPRRLDLEVFDHYPTTAELDGLPRRVVVPPGGRAEVAYRIRPRRRGDAAFGRVEVWRRAAGDLLRRRGFVGDTATVRVLPNFRPVLTRGLAAVEQRLARSGFHAQRRRGEGREFQELRDFRTGDPLRLVDWKATARSGRMIARQYQEERDQQVMLLLDCGRRMHAQEGDLTHFDHVLDAALLLAYVAVRQGDAVGVQAFGGEERWLAPVSGPAALHRVLDVLHDLETTSEAPDFVAAVERLMAGQRRRALVLLVTNLRDEDTAELLPALAILRRRHLVIVASTRERALAELRDQEVADFDAALEVAAAHHYLEARRRAHLAARATGAFVLDVEAPELPAALVARYLDIKRAGAL